MSGYRIALLDWLACAARGVREPAARAARELGDPVALAGTAGHVLDFDDTYLPGIAHLSAPTAPAALVVAAELGLRAGDALAAYEEGFEAMGALARASHPALYDRGWHPTAVCGGRRRGRGGGAAARGAARARGRAGAAERVGSARGLRLARQVAPGRPRGGVRRASGAARRGGRARAARGGGARLGGGHRRHVRRAGAGRQRDRRELDQGLALLPADARRDRGRGRRARAGPGRL